MDILNNNYRKKRKKLLFKSKISLRAYNALADNFTLSNLPNVIFTKTSLNFSKIKYSE